MSKKILHLTLGSILFLLLAGWSALTFAAALSPEQVICNEMAQRNTIYGVPIGDKGNTLIVRQIYCLSNNQRTKFADWVAYRLDKESVTGPSQTEREWEKDPELSIKETLEPKDYRGAYDALETDRGHQAPLASFKGTSHWRDTNYLSNITPQKKFLNRYSWVDLENKVRALAKKQTIYVMTGPLFERPMAQLPQATKAHMVPSGYWKIIAAPAQGEEPIQVVGFIFEQETPKDSQVKEHVVTINEIEKRSGIDFFWQIPDTIEEAIESKTTLNHWQ